LYAENNKGQMSEGVEFQKTKEKQELFEPFGVIVNGFGRTKQSDIFKSNGEEQPSSNLTCLHTGLKWYCSPDSWTEQESERKSDEIVEIDGGKWMIEDCGSKLIIYPPGKKDYWRKTYYEPILVKDDAPFLYYTFPSSSDDHKTIEVTMHLIASTQFDQAGLMIRYDSDHWLKTGIEVVDNTPRLSCVVTNIYSDWSTQPWKSTSFSMLEDNSEESSIVHVDCSIRVHCRGNSYVVEARHPSSNVGEKGWELVRIAHLNTNMQCSPDPLEDHPAIADSRLSTIDREVHESIEQELWMGVYAASPVNQDGNCSAIFTNFSIRSGSSFDHTAN
jgi:regulation of enolase protein 1 (concanavalin A-like superfamily)